MAQLMVALLAIAALYATVWPHELGHFAVAYLSGCKVNWWQTDTSWFVWGSRHAPKLTFVLARKLVTILNAIARETTAWQA